jgi:hypothetical protein
MDALPGGLFMGFSGILFTAAAMATAGLAARAREADEEQREREHHDSGGGECLPFHDQKPMSLPV